MPINTKNTMKSSLKKIIKRKPLSKITISDIADDCGISRMTFYYHFKDIYDLVEWCIISDAHETADEKILVDTWENELVTIFEVARMNKDFYLALFRSMDRELVERYLLRYTNTVATRIVSEYSAKAKFREEDKARLTDYCSNAIMGIIICWAMNDMEENPVYIAQYLSNMVKNGIVPATHFINESNIPLTK